MATKKNTAEWGVEYFRRHKTDDPGEAVPGRDFLSSIPPKVRARFVTLLEVIAGGPPMSFGGGYWEVMHDSMAGYYEVRVDSKDTHYRLFCLLERDGRRSASPDRASSSSTVRRSRSARCSRRTTTPRSRS